MSERSPQPSSPERFTVPKENAEQHSKPEQEHHQHERQPKHNAEQAAHAARETIEKQAISGKEVYVGNHEKPSKAREDYSPAARKQTYRLTMQRLQNRMPAAERQFSRFIHVPAVERLSEATNNTIARPSGVLGSGVLAVLGMGLLYWLSRRSGFELSGNELLIFILAGWLLGLLAEFGVRLFRRLLDRS